MVRPIITQDGSKSLVSEQFGVEYHSIYGAVEESLHVFICAGLQRLRLDNYSTISILEMGLGTGLNAFLTLAEAQRYPALSLDYHAIEAYPLDMAIVSELEYASYLQLDHCHDHFLAMHSAKAEEVLQIDNFKFSKQHIRFENLEPRQRYDIIYYDAFGPTTQAELWEEDSMRTMYGCLRPGGILVTYCAKGSFKRALKAVGFEVEALPGPAKKREMTRAWKIGDL